MSEVVPGPGWDQDPQAADLHAYVDGELPPERRAAVEQRLRRDPAAARAVAHWQAQKAALRILFATGSDPAWLSEVRSLAKRRRMRLGLRRAGMQIRRRSAWMLAGLVGASMAVLLSYATAPVSADRTATVRELDGVAARIAGTHLSAAGVKPLALPLPADPGPPDLSAFGWALLGGRDVALIGGPATQYRYAEPATGREISVVVGLRDGDGRPSFSYMRFGGKALLTRIEPPLAYAIVGDLTRPEVLALADAVHLDLSKRSPTPLIGAAPDLVRPVGTKVPNGL